MSRFKEISAMLRITVGKETEDYTTIQEALDAIPYTVKAEIEIHPGIYKEKIFSDKRDLTIRGIGNVVITWGDSSREILDRNMKRGTFRSYTAFFSGEKLLVENITFANTAGSRDTAGQALALYLDVDEASLLSVKLEGQQDTLFLAPLPEKEREANGFYGPRHLLPRRRCRTYVKDSLIIGTSDYIFGGGDALFEDCEIRNIDQGIAVAPSGEADWDGFAFRHCRFFTMYPDRDESFLMRPWRKDGKASFVDCTFDDKFMPSEYNPKWPDDDKSAFMLKGKVLPDGREVGEWISLDNLSENEKFFEDSV